MSKINLVQADNLGRLTFHPVAFLRYLRRPSYHSFSGIMLPFVNKDASQPAKVMYGVPTPVVCAYGAFASIGYLVFHTVAERESSSVLTMSALAQCLGITMMCIQSLSSGSAAGISAKSLLLDAFAISFRLCSTLWLDGYLPSDKSGDFIYQAFDVCSLLLLIFLLHRVLVKQCDTYQASVKLLFVKIKLG